MPHQPNHSDAPGGPGGGGGESFTGIRPAEVREMRSRIAESRARSFDRLSRGRVPFGYRLDRDHDGRPVLVTAEEQATIVRALHARQARAARPSIRRRLRRLADRVLAAFRG